MAPISAPIRLGNIKTTGDVRGTEAEMKTLMASMKEVNQLQEVVLNSRHELIAGRRRLEAARRLGWTHIRASIMDCLDDAIKALKAERDENCPGCRVALSRKELLELGRKLEALENPEAAARKAATQAKKNAGKVGEGKFPSPETRGKVKDKVGEVLGMSGRTLQKAQQIIDAAQKEPDRYLDLAEKVQQDKQPIDPVYEEFKARRDEQSRDKVGEPIPKRLVKVFNDPWRADVATAIEGLLVTVMAEVRRRDKEDIWLDPGIIQSLEAASSEVESAAEWLRKCEPHAVCPKCKGAGCRPCKDAGWLPKRAYDALKVK